MKNKFTIIVPAFNSENTLDECLQSVIYQTYTDWECIVIDDCSTDTTSQIINEYLIKDNRIRIIRNNKNMGPSYCRNLGIDNSCGEFIVFLDSDDFLEYDFLEYSDYVFRNEICDWLITPLRVFCSGGLTHYPLKFKKTVFESLEELPFSSESTDVGHVIACVYKKDIIGRTRFVNDMIFEDFPFNMEIICKNPKVYISDKYFYNYVKRKDSITGKGFRNKKDIELLRKTVKEICDRNEHISTKQKSNFLVHVEKVIKKYSNNII